MSSLFFPDNTVLVNFALIGRVDLFGHLARGRSAWSWTVSVECERSAGVAGLESLTRMPEILGEPLMPTVRERTDTRLLRLQIADAGDPESRHLGEAEALAIIAARQIEAVFITDDRDAIRLAGSLGIRTYTTADLIRLCVRAELISPEDAWSHVGVLRANQRSLKRVPKEFAPFVVWCAGPN